MTKKNENTASEALRAAQETLRKAASTVDHIGARDDARKRIENETGGGLVGKVRDMAIAARRINKVWDACQDLYTKVRPWVGPVLRPVGAAAVGLKNAFVWAAYERDGKGMKLDKHGDPIFSFKRLGRTFGLAAGIGLASVVAVQGAYYHGTQFQETIYTSDSKQELVDGRVYQFSGCTSLPCSTSSETGKYFRIEQSLYWPRLMYPEQDVFANIPSRSVCEVKGYGLYFRSLRRVSNWLEMYQNVYDVSCRPLTDRETSNAIQGSLLPSSSQAAAPASAGTPLHNPWIGHAP